LEIIVHWLSGAFDAALNQARESVTWNSSGMARRRAVGLTFAVHAGVERGRLTEARRYLDVATAAFGDSRSWAYWRDLCLHAGAVLQWREGEPATALHGLRHHAASLLQSGALPFAAFALIDLAEMAGEAGHAEAGAEALAGLEVVDRRLDRDLYRGLATIGSSWAALATGDARRAAASGERAVGVLQGLGYQPFTGRAFAVLGRALSFRDRPRAREATQTAATIFDACGAVWRRDRCLDTLRRLGGPPRGAGEPSPPSGPAALSRREREVARLAAQGRTAPDIARELFIGERTVESHLGRIYAKLGVASKLELVQRAGVLGLLDTSKPGYG
jgi:ATP/maltotriose-dependent transcriptional regulator MalT